MIHHYESKQYQKTYPMIAEMLDQMFPSVVDRKYVPSSSDNPMLLAFKPLTLARQDTYSDQA